jgi:DHA1 family multidrug resistance protein-like MFS transporter
MVSPFKLAKITPEITQSNYRYNNQVDSNFFHPAFTQKFTVFRCTTRVEQDGHHRALAMQNNRRKIAILFFTMVVVMMGFGMVIPILPFYIIEFGAGGSAMGLLMASYAVMQLIFSPIWGGISDRIGRKPVLMIGVFGFALTQLMFGFSTELWMLLASRVLAGVLSSATLPTAMAYIGDSTSERDRGGGMGIIGAAMGVGMILGPGIAGWMAAYSLAAPFFFAAGLSVISLILIFLLLPESLPSDKQVVSGAKIQGPQLRELWMALFSPIGLLLLMAFLVSFGLTNFEIVFGLYAVETFGYGPQQVGGLLTFIGLISALVQGGLTGPFTRRWGEVAVIKASLLGSAFGFAMMVMARSFTAVLLTMGFFVISNAMLRPAVSALISRRATVGQGVAMGLNNAFMSLGRSVGPLWAGFVYDINSAYPYWSGSLIMLVGFVISLRRLKADPVIQPIDIENATITEQ